MRFSYAQVCDSNSFQSIYWNKGIHDARITNVNIPSSGNIFISGYTESGNNKNTDAWIMKITSRGNPLWSRAIGTFSSETINAAKRTNHGGFIIIGGTRDGSVYDEGWIAKTDSNGIPRWSVKLGTSFSSLYQVAQLTDDGYAAAGSLYLDFSGDRSGNVTQVRKSTNIVIRFDRNGNTVWWKSFHFADIEKLNTITQLIDGSLLVAGNIVNTVSGYLIKMDAQSGNIIWMNGYENASEFKYGHGSELADGSIQLTTANKIYHFTADGKTLPGEYIILSSGGVDYKYIKPEDIGFVSPDVEIYFANVSPYPVLFAIKNDSIIWAQTFNQNKQNLRSFNDGKVYDKHIYLTGVYQANNLSDGNAGENLTYLIKADTQGKTFCADSFDISMNVVSVPAGENINHDWIYEGVLHPQLMQLYSEPLEPIRLSDCYTENCCRDTIIQREDSICEGSSYILPDGLIVKDTGNYVTAFSTAAGCDSIIRTHLFFKQRFNFSLGGDTCFKDNASVIFNLPQDSSVRYTWQDGSHNFNYTATFAGLYWVTATSFCNSMTDSVRIFDNCMPPVRIPSAFTPNKDGLNDIFHIINMNSQRLLNFNIYNRYGELIFATDDAQRGWDGTFKSNPQPSGAYVYLIRYTDLQNKPHMRKGTVVLLR